MQPHQLSPLQQGPKVWLGPAMAASRSWMEPLSPADIAEIEAAAAALHFLMTLERGDIQLVHNHTKGALIAPLQASAGSAG